MTQYTFSEIDHTVVRDFAQRTLVNLEFIEQHYASYREGKSKAEVFEITQLINSALGLLVFPKESFWDYVRPIPLSDLKWLEFKQVRHYKGENCDTLKDLVRLIRNSISHFNVVFKGEKDYIARLEMWNENKSGRTTWKAEIDIFKFKEFVIYFVKGIIDDSLLNLPN